MSKIRNHPTKPSLASNLSKLMSGIKSTDTPVNELTNELVDESTDIPVNELTNALVDESTDIPVNELSLIHI